MSTILFRARKPIQWNGVKYEPGEVFEIEEGNPRLRAMIEQSHHLEYANTEIPSESQGTSVNVIRE